MIFKSVIHLANDQVYLWENKLHWHLFIDYYENDNLIEWENIYIYRGRKFMWEPNVTNSWDLILWKRASYLLSP